MLIGLTGKRGSGKDFVYHRIKSLYNSSSFPVERIAFADKLKDSAAALLGVPVRDLEYHKNHDDWSIDVRQKTEHGSILVTTLSVREYLQRYGTEAHRRIFADDFWIKAALPDKFEHFDRIAIVTDVRFDNEAKRIIELGGEVWEIKSPQTADQSDSHASEVPISRDLVICEIDNDHTAPVASLDSALRWFVSHYEGKA